MPASLLAWIVLLAWYLHDILGAGITSEWIAAGVIFTFSALFVLWMAREIIGALHMQVVRHSSMRSVSEGRSDDAHQHNFEAWLAGKDRFDASLVERKRLMLGLQPCPVRANRLRRPLRA